MHTSVDWSLRPGLNPASQVHVYFNSRACTIQLPYKAGITLCEIARIICVIIKSAAPLRFIIGSVAVFITCFLIHWQAVFTRFLAATGLLTISCLCTMNDIANCQLPISNCQFENNRSGLYRRMARCNRRNWQLTIGNGARRTQP